MAKLMVVIGVTGRQGSNVARTFQSLPGWKVRGLTRNPSNPVALEFANQGVDIVKADLDDKQSLSTAFDGATAIFCNTDFFSNIFAYMSDNDPSGRTPNQRAFDQEVTQGLNVAEAAATPKVLETLECFIYSTLCDATKWSKGKYTTVYHNDCKRETVRQIESKFPEVAKRMRLAQFGHYVSNWKVFPAMMPQKQPDGSFLVRRVADPNSITPFVMTERDSGEFVKALLDLPPGSELLCTSEMMTWVQWTKLWGEVNGVKASYQDVDKKEFFEGIPAPLAEELGEAYEFMREFGFTGGDPAVLTPDQLKKPLRLTSMREYIESEDWSSVL